MSSTPDYGKTVKGRDAVRIVAAVRQQCELVDEKRRAYKEAQRETKRRKGALESALERLEWLGSEPQESGTPLVDLMDGEAWRGVPLPHAISPGIALKIEEGLGFQTLGELQDWQREEAGRLEEVNGVGEERAAIANEEILQFFLDHPEYRATGEDEEPSEGD